MYIKKAVKSLLDAKCWQRNKDNKKITALERKMVDLKNDLMWQDAEISKLQARLQKWENILSMKFAYTEKNPS